MRGVRDRVNLVTNRVGRRGLFLSILGVSYILYGLGDGFHYSVNAYDPADLIERYHLSWIWVYVGLLALIASVLRVRFPLLDEPAYGLLMMPPLFWFLSFFIAWVQYGRADFYNLFIVSGTLVLLIFHCARNMMDRIQ